MADRPQSLPAQVWERVNDQARCDTLAALSAMESHKDDDFNRLNRLAASLFAAPSAAIAVVDAEKAWLVAATGTDLLQIPVSESLAAHAISGDGVLFVSDAAADQRFAHSRVVTGPPLIRFYVGAPILVHGQPIGALQVFAPTPRDAIERARIPQLEDLAATAGTLFELKHEARVRARTAAELIREEWRHALTLEAGRVGSWVWDIRSDEVVANDIMRRMYGIAGQGSLRMEQLLASIEPGDRAAVDAALKATFDEGTDFAVEFRIAGSGRWLVGRGRVYQRDAQNAPLVMMGVNIDVTDARRAAEHTRLLLRELNHRVKNTLAMIQSLARQTLRQAPEPQKFIDSFAGRLRTLSDAHSLLSERDWSGIGLIELIEMQVLPYVVAEPGQLRLEGEDAQLPPDHALGLGLILHELATNAAQFGALSRPEGSVDLRWSIAGSPPVLDLTWTEQGGPDVIEPQQRGLGARLIERGLDKIIDSQVELRFVPSGVAAHIRLPLSGGA